MNVCAGVTSELPAGCYLSAFPFPCSPTVTVSGLATREFAVGLPIACAPDAVPGSYAISVEAQIAHDASNGYDEDVSDNARSTSGTLRVR